MSQSVYDFLDFVRRSPTAFHAVDAICEMLRESDFVQLNEYEPWRIIPGGRYYVTRNGSSVIALIVPESGVTPVQIVASHSDSPAFKLKYSAEETVCGHYVRLNTECYGGMLMASWFDRPLSIAGRVLVREGNDLTARLVDLGRDAALIPNMPIHFNRAVNDGYKYNPQVDLLPLFGDERAAGTLMEEIAGTVGVDCKALQGGDLFLYSRDPGIVWGARGEFFSCPRIDDLECAYASLKAFLSTVVWRNAPVLAVFDNEEVGSGTKQGANSTFLGDVLYRAWASLGATDSEIRAALAASFLVSADNAHAVHPNHPEKYDADNRAYMNEGVVLKYNANQKYTTDGVSAAVFGRICEAVDVPVQRFANRSDVPGGSTLGNLLNAQISMNSVDIGLAQLAMHSCCETAGSEDVDFMISALRRYYETAILMRADGRLTLA